MPGKSLTQNDMISLVAENCSYHKYEVEDVLRAFYTVLKRELEEGNQVRFEKLFRVHIERPCRKRIYNPTDNYCYLSPAHPKLKFIPSQRYKYEELWSKYNGKVFIDKNEKTT